MATVVLSIAGREPQRSLELLAVDKNLKKSDFVHRIDFFVVGSFSLAESELYGKGPKFLIHIGEKSAEDLTFLKRMKQVFPKISIEIYTRESWREEFPEIRRNPWDNFLTLRERIQEFLERVAERQEAS